jgi:hypothetical protein
MAGDETGRPRESQEEADYRDGPPTKRNPTLWVTLGVLGVGLVGLLVILAFSWLLLASPAPPPALPAAAPGPALQDGPPSPNRRIWSREELKTAIMGKTEVEVTWVLGPPVEATNGDDGEPIWTYRRIVRDPVTGASDQFVYVDFKNGRVAKLRY